TVTSRTNRYLLRRNPAYRLITPPGLSPYSATTPDFLRFIFSNLPVLGLVSGLWLKTGFYAMKYSERFPFIRLRVDLHMLSIYTPPCIVLHPYVPLYSLQGYVLHLLYSLYFPIH
ncbi:hypothetical protein K438DRAFT_1889493, partial [Mycena galopus ATCC 62051]